MPGIKLYSSNRLETLADRLALIVGRDPLDPFEEEIIVVEPIGMERWLSQQLSLRLGTWANCSYPFPNRMLERLFDAVLPEQKEDPLSGEKIISWRLYSLLPGLAGEKDFHELRNYLAGDDRQVKRYQLSKKLADTFFQYITYRPDMMRDWEDKKVTHWQAALWRRLTADAGGRHRAWRFFACCEKLAAPGLFSDYHLPRRINLFGISALPLMHLEALRAVAGHSDVNIFFLNPCREYWADVRNEWERMRLEKTGPPAELYVESGNSLLASLGKTGRDFLWTLIDRDAEFEDLGGGEADDGQAEGDTVLHVVQSDILQMTDRGSGAGEGPFARAPSDAIDTTVERIVRDNSLRVASCHSPMREVEVLYDYLLERFNEDGSLEPGDILVMTPDIETYAPLVQTVFGSPEEESLTVPYAIADRGLRSRSVLVRAFFQCIECARGRFGAGEVLDLLQYPDIRRRFDMEGTDIDMLRRWVAETGIRWGMDAPHRASMDLPATNRNTWRAGIDRLLLGYAFPAGGEELFMDILPFDDVEGFAARELGKFIEFFRKLRDGALDLAIPRNPVEWQRTICLFLENMFMPDDLSGRDMNALREAVGRFAEETVLADLDETIEFDVVRSWLSAEMDSEKTAKNFLSGKVTVCALRPMRSVPFKIICVLGMNDGVFPRNPPAPGFDLMAAAPRRGERSVRDEDRFLFMETLISAREKLYISYCGQSLRDNSPLPLSPVVSELLDYCEQAFVVNDGGIRDLLVTEHPLQAFSPRYFTGKGRLYSYSRRNCAASVDLGRSRRESPFIDDELPCFEDTDIPLELLAGFFQHPARTFLKERLGMRLDEGRGALEEKEPFAIAGLDHYLLGNDLCRGMLEGRRPDEKAEIYRAAGRLPHGVPGETAFQLLLPEVRSFTEKVSGFLEGNRYGKADIRLTVGGTNVSGRLENLTSQGQVIYEYVKGGARRRITAWLRHLVLNAIDADLPCPRETFLICRDGVWHMKPLDEGNGILERLVQVFFSAMKMPPPYYPESSLACARSIHQGKPSELAIQAARERWEGARYAGAPPGEGDDPYNHQITGGVLPLSDEFVALSGEIFIPMLNGQEER